jgi:hypothetical protein
MNHPISAIPDGPSTYITALGVTEIFADHSYQRPLDTARVTAMVAQWDLRLVGVIDVSDRGAAAHPRYAVVEGQHRWAAAKQVNPIGVIVARVHTGLSKSQEAQLFTDIDATRRRLTTWDQWKARRRAGDVAVTTIEAIATRVGLVVDNAPTDGRVRCVKTLERIAAWPNGELLLRDTLFLLREIWGKQLAAYDSALVAGLALLLRKCGTDEAFETDRFIESLIDFTPTRILYIAKAKGEHNSAPLPKRVALTLLERYNTRSGPKLAAPAGLTRRRAVFEQSDRDAA